MLSLLYNEIKNLKLKTRKTIPRYAFRFFRIT